jgi:hypothetical protein
LVVSAKDIEVIRTPVEAPKADAIADRFGFTVRRECLDWNCRRRCRPLLSTDVIDRTD